MSPDRGGRYWCAMGVMLVFASANAINGVAAQTDEVSPPRTMAPPVSGLEKVVVTATKRAAPLQSVPVAITVLNGVQLERGNLNTLGALTSQTPFASFRVGASNKDSALFIRGIGTVSTSPGAEPAVSTVIDGVVLGRPGQTTVDLLDVDRVELLRGPQGTLFGKNASAGVIDIISRQPGPEPATLDMSYFGNGERRLRLRLSSALEGNVAAASLALLHARYAGNVKNLTNGTKVNGYERSGARARLNVMHRPAAKLALIADYASARDTSPSGVPSKIELTTYPNNIPVAPNLQFLSALHPLVPSLNSRDIVSDIETHLTDVNWGLSSQLDWESEAYRITSITAFRQWENAQVQDQDRLSRPFAQFPRTVDHGDVKYDQSTQELRIGTIRPASIDLVGGLFFMTSKNRENYRRDVARCASPVQSQQVLACLPEALVSDAGAATYAVQMRSLAVFGEGTFQLSPTLRAVAGVRWTQDDQRFRHRRESTRTEAFPGV